MTLHGIQVPLLSLTPRLYLLRTLVISSLLLISVNIGWTLFLTVDNIGPDVWVSLYTVIVVHQIIRWYWIVWYTMCSQILCIYSTFKWPILYAVVDIPLLIAEVIGPSATQVRLSQIKWRCTCFIVGAGHYAKSIALQSWFPETLVFHAVLAWIVAGALSLTICFRIGEAICSKGQSLIRPFDILAYESKLPQSTTLKKGWKSTFHMLFGRSIWKKNFV